MKYLCTLLALILMSAMICSCKANGQTTSESSVEQETENAVNTQPVDSEMNTVEDMDLPFNWNIQTEAYSITEYDGVLYLNFTDAHRATEEQMQNCQIGEVSFSSLDDMRKSFMNNDFSSDEYIVMQSSFQKEEQGLRLCNLNALWDAQRPSDTRIVSVSLSGEYYDHHVTEENMFSFGWVRYVSAQRRDSLKERDYIQYNKSYRTVTRKEASVFDGVPCEIVESNSEYEYYRDIYIELAEEEKSVCIVLRYLIDYTKDDGRLIPSEIAPARVLMYGEQDGTAFVVSLYEFSQPPTYAWLTSFGLAPFVPSADSGLLAE